MIIHQLRQAIGGSQIGAGLPFHILGFDLMIDQKLKAWILEVNHSPSLNIHFQKDEILRDKLSAMKGGSTPNPAAEVVAPHICPVDLYVKSKVVADAINLAWKVSTGEKGIDEFGSLSKIYPNEDDGEAA